MNSVPASWNCPTCHNVLVLETNTWRCKNNHSFDLAKEGYVNLLLAHQKNSKEPGDNKAMVNARRAFLEQGHYLPLAETVARIFAEYVESLEDKSELAFFDAGCGEGYYSNVVSKHIQTLEHVCRFSGIDISKNAVLKAAKKYPDSFFAVASTYQLPVATHSQDAVLQIFAPSSEHEIRRVLKSTGVWITVNPASNHLQEMKQALYDTPTENKDHSDIPEGFELTKHQNVSFTVPLTTEAVRESLLMMTPYYWTATPDKKQFLIESLELVTTDFDIRVYQSFGN
ncbi:methyltransferase domain-containing protein [Paraglaciecola aquimarina]|uniref:Methyltransferase domain-containing protein n=1 Tax=Paraglaciecola algarum TaxID=3050085 RepID=A0ABS9D8X3_9ALTE|nr:methyltransferase domain-containing protein [Paraglaciecola sp. G1-23]MCF2949378.1 methyltransferase domain-containing protein [Paraglaciecola sp. G1-23]